MVVAAKTLGSVFAPSPARNFQGSRPPRGAFQSCFAVADVVAEAVKTFLTLRLSCQNSTYLDSWVVFELSPYIKSVTAVCQTFFIRKFGNLYHWSTFHSYQLTGSDGNLAASIVLWLCAISINSIVPPLRNTVTYLAMTWFVHAILLRMSRLLAECLWPVHS